MFLGKKSRKHYKFLPPWIELDLVIQGDGHQGTTDEFATIPFHLVLFSAALVEQTNSIPVHSLILSSHLFLCPPLLFPFTVFCRIVFAKPEDFEALLDQGQEFIIFSNGCLDLSANLLIGNMVFVQNVT